MAKEKQQHSTKNEALDALEGIRSKYSRIRVRDIEKFAPVYYPIAIMEMRLEEQTFEDFETVQLTVLRLVDLGISDHKVIAQTLGLSPNYVFKVMRLLNGYGHISGDRLTPLGRESLEKEKKIVTTETLQKFQMDALNGTLLKVGQAVTENMLSDKSETARIIGHLNYLDGISSDVLRSQLSGNSCESYLHQKSGILHTNVTAVKEARCCQIQYAKCYLLKLCNEEYPIVFAKRYDRNKKDIKDRFSWQPFSVRDSSITARYGFEPETCINSECANTYIMELYNMMVEYGQKVNLEEEVRRAVTRMYPFEEEGLSFTIPAGICAGWVDVSAQALRQYRGSLLNFLIGAHNDGEYLITNEYLFGHIVSLRIVGSDLTALAELLARKADQRGKHEISRALRDHFRNYEDDEALTEMMIKAVAAL